MFRLQHLAQGTGRLAPKPGCQHPKSKPQVACLRSGWVGFRLLAQAQGLHQNGNSSSMHRTTTPELAMYSTSSTLAARCLPRYWFAAVLASLFPSLPPAWEEELSICLTTAGADAGANYRFAVRNCARCIGVDASVGCHASMRNQTYPNKNPSRMQFMT